MVSITFSPDEPRASIKVTHLNRVCIETGRSHKPHILDFDSVLNEDVTPIDVYESTTKSLVEDLMQGYNGCLIVYGSSGSRKAHTIQGNSGSTRHGGIISCAAEDIFSSPKASQCRIRVSFYQIFNEKIYDLLDPKRSEIIWFREAEDAVCLDGLTEVEVSSAQHLLQVHHNGSALRQKGIPKRDFLNCSHMVFNIVVLSSTTQAQGKCSLNKLPK
ncbi:hypothetical protein DNTS_035370 [Danionella cerebrum]|uniref:Kinesin motor domain-containing protein n=1 Tax=Danionella cerebrum TaxID=2873325 RepID=A0A553Q1J0_9TELE|nr:hypothetical protein DNTS_035370 [Danionella translucida]